MLWKWCTISNEIIYRIEFIIIWLTISSRVFAKPRIFIIKGFANAVIEGIISL